MARPESEQEYMPDGKPYQGTLIRELRHGTNKSVAAFAEELGIHRASLSAVETNRAKAGRLLLSRIAGKIGIAMEELSEVPIHPRVIKQKELQKTRSLLNVGDQINGMLSEANFSPAQQNLAELLILDTSRAIILRLGTSSKY